MINLEKDTIRMIYILFLKELLLLKEQIIEIKKNRSLAFKNNAPFFFLNFKNRWCINRKGRRFRCCNANVQFA